MLKHQHIVGIKFYQWASQSSKLNNLHIDQYFCLFVCLFLEKKLWNLLFVDHDELVENVFFTFSQ